MNNLFLAGGHDPELRETAQEIAEHAVDRAGGIAWEYLFPFGGGRPPWVSGLAQGTAIQALSRAAVRLKRARAVRRRAARARRLPHAAAVRASACSTGAGAHYLAYSYAPGQRIYNAFFQSIIGLHDFATFANDPLGRRLWLEGERQARLEVARADTGSWSLYQPGRQSDIGYHKVLRDFVRRLCDRLNTDRQREVIELRAVEGPAAVLESVADWPDPGAVLRRDAELQPLPLRAAAGAGAADAGGIARERAGAAATASALRDCAHGTRAHGRGAARRARPTPAAVWALLADTASWTDWAASTSRGARRTARRTPRASAPTGCSTHGRVRNEEEIERFEPGRVLGYRVIGGNIPVRDYHSEVTLTPHGERRDDDHLALALPGQVARAPAGSSPGASGRSCRRRRRSRLAPRSRPPGELMPAPATPAGPRSPAP